ncbi:helix-loop-helix DNA-binding domain-containing protein [Jimgerdemannia flammicorona]|nr:helix-loop-helix DNA-binding domain-containing protein [Jimgerdemannia flammicorona]
MQQMFEKRKRRRESHNAVERRRRDNINEKIQELSTLLPEAIVDGANKPNKGAILRKSVDHIKSLQSDVVKYQFKIRELESMLETVRNGGTLPPTNNNNGKDKSSSPVMQPQQGMHPLQQHPQHQNTILMAGLDGSGFINVNNGIALQNGGNA